MKHLEILWSYQDPKYAAFMQKLLPTVSQDSIIGVRAPIMQKLTKQWIEDQTILELISCPKHTYHEENCIHGYWINHLNDLQNTVDALEIFLPFVDNWAVCDLIRPKSFCGSQNVLLPSLLKWIDSDHPYTIRFAVEMLMVHYLDDHFSLDYPDRISKINSNEYYVNMMVAWYFASALAVQYDSILPYLQEARLSKWIHNKTIQKAVESYRIAPQQKVYLKTLRLR